MMRKDEVWSFGCGSYGLGLGRRTGSGGEGGEAVDSREGGL